MFRKFIYKYNKIMKSNHKKLFGTDGIRGTVNGDKVNALMAVNIAMAAGEYFYGKAGTKRPRVLIGKIQDYRDICLNLL